MAPLAGNEYEKMIFQATVRGYMTGVIDLRGLIAAGAEMDKSIAFAAARCGEAEFADYFPDAFCSIDVEGWTIVLTEPGGVRLCAARAAHTANIFAVWKDGLTFKDLTEVYAALQKLSDYSFYAGETAELSALTERKPAVQYIDERKIERLMRAGGFDRVKGICERFFAEITADLPEPELARAESARLISCLLRGGDNDAVELTVSRLINDGITVKSAEHTVISIVEHLRAECGRTKRHSPMIADTLEIIEKNLSNEDLSLRWIAQEVLFTNADYLGKLFKREVGDNFTGYVKSMRMELAKKLILEGKRDRIYEVAEKVGFGTNSQYFSQVFKKYTGVSPLEYKSVMQNNHGVNNLYGIQMGESV